MQRKFLTNLLILLFVNILIKPFWILGIDRTVQNTLGASDYGFYYAVFNFSFLFNILLDMGITNFNNRNIAQNSHLLNKHLSSILILKLMLSGVYIIITLVTALVIGYDSEHIRILLLLGANQILISATLYLRSNISGLHFFKTDSLISVLDRFLMIIICGVLIWGNVLNEPFSITWFIYGQSAAYLITTIVALLVVIRKAKFKKLKWNWPFFLLIIRKSFPFAVLVLLMTFYNRIDTVMLERMLPDGDEQSGIYASSYRLLDATNMIAYLFSVILLPMFSRMIKHKEPVSDLVQLSFSMLITGATIVAIASIVFSKDLMGLLYTSHIEESARVFKLLMGCFVPIATTYVFGTLLTANGNLKVLNIVAISGMTINIGLNILLIPLFKAEGSAVASLITQLITAILQVILAIRILKLNIGKKFMFSLLLFVASSIVIGLLLSRIEGWWVMRLIGLIVAGFVMSSTLKLLSLRGLLKIISNKSQ